jgi:serine/threonine-protein kinase RsbW
MGNSVLRTLVADIAAPCAVRRMLREWLSELDWPAEDGDDVVLAVSEAVTNAVDHAYPPEFPGIVEVEAHQVRGPEQDRYLVVRVSDHGRWRPQPGWHENRRRGLQLMRACSREIEVLPSTSGTTVRLTSALVPGMLTAELR